MLSLLAESRKQVGIFKKETHKSRLLRREIIKNLAEVIAKAKNIDDKELLYLTSMALESAREKLFLQMYERADVLA